MAGSIRFGTEADARAIAEVDVRAWRWAYRDLLPAVYLATMTIEARERWWREWFAHRDTTERVLVWDEDEVIRGFVSYAPATSEVPAQADRGKLTALYLDEELVGQGVGRALHDAAVEELRAIGFEDAVVWVFEDNARTLAFFSRQRWAPDGGRRGTMFGTTRPAQIRLARRLAL